MELIMNRLGQWIKTRPVRTALVTLLAAVCIAAAAETVYVQTASVPIRQEMSSLGKVVVRVPKGAKLEILSHEASGWVKVQFTDKEGKTYTGYCMATALSPKPVEDSALDMFGSGGGDADAPSAALAGKGLLAEAEQYATSKNLNPAYANEMVDIRNSLTPEQLRAFQKEGKVGESQVTK